MNPEWLYQVLVYASWLFLGGWLIVLAAACAIEFRGEWSQLTWLPDAEAHPSPREN